MNKYQKQINKLTKQKVKQVLKQFLEKEQKYCKIPRGSGKSFINLQRYFKFMYIHDFYNSKKYYRYVRKNIKKYIKQTQTLDALKFKREYDCIWIGGKEEYK